MNERFFIISASTFKTLFIARGCTVVKCGTKCAFTSRIAQVQHVKAVISHHVDTFAMLFYIKTSCTSAIQLIMFSDLQGMCRRCMYQMASIISSTLLSFMYCVLCHECIMLYCDLLFEINFRCNQMCRTLADPVPHLCCTCAPLL